MFRLQSWVGPIKSMLSMSLQTGSLEASKRDREIRSILKGVVCDMATLLIILIKLSWG